MLTLEGTWTYHGQAAEILGISPTALAKRRAREGRNHPRHVMVGRATLYFEPALRQYAQDWRDGRLR